MLFGGITIPGHPDPSNVARMDRLIIPQIGLMERKGIAINPPHLHELSLKLSGMMAELRKDILQFIPADRLEAFVSDGEDISFNIDSPEQIGKLLFDHLGVGRGRKLKLTKAGDRISTGKKQLETLKRDHPVIPLILQYRECSKLKSTYADTLPKIAKTHNKGLCSICGYTHREAHPRIHTSILTTRTDTGRLASKKPNLQNIPARSKLGQEVRKAFVAEHGKLLIGYDYSQIEIRLMAHAAQEPNMMRIFHANGDIHMDTACRAFNLDYDYYLGLADKDDQHKLTVEEKQIYSDFKLYNRAPCKNVTFGVAYGLGPPGLYDLMAVTYATAGKPLPDWLDIEWCENFILKWFNLYPQAAEYFDLQHWRARRYGITWCMFGGVRRIPEIRSVHERIVQAGLRQAGNNPIQRGAAGVFKLGMARTQSLFDRLFAENGIRVDPLLPIHDELIAECDEEWADEVGVWMGHEMEDALVDEETGELCCRVPIAVDGKTSAVWTK